MRPNNKPQNLLAPLFLVALALALNLHALAADSFWGDEILTASFASRSSAEVIRWTASDIHPPLYYLLAGRFAQQIVPLGRPAGPTAASDWLWRFPSVLTAVLTVAVTYRLGLSICNCQLLISKFRRSRSRWVPSPHPAVLAALLLAVAPIAIKYGQEARMHGLFMLLSALSTWLLFRALVRPERWPRWLIYVLVITANIYTMYFGFLILAAHGILVISQGLRVINNDFIKQKSKSPPSASPTSLLLLLSKSNVVIGFGAAVILAALAYLPWWPVLFDILRRRAAVGAIEGGVGQPVEFLRGVVQALGPRPEPVAWGFLILFFIGLIFLARRSWHLAMFGGLWLALPAALPLVLGDPRALQFRYAFILPIYLTIIAYGVVSLAEVITGNRGTSRWKNLSIYFIWLLVTVSFLATLNIYRQTKPDWRGAAAYLDAHTRPADIILIGPLWDEGRFIDYYRRGQAQLLTPAALVTNIEGHAAGMRAGGGRVWAVNRFEPTETATARNVVFSGVVISEPQLAVYEPALLTEGAIDLAQQAVDAAYPWAEKSEAEGVLNPDPRTAQAAALRALGDTLIAAGRTEEAIGPYQRAVDIFPGWVNGFIALAETQAAVGNLPAAADAYRQAVAYNLEWQGPQADRAAALVEAGQWAAAVETYHLIVKAD